MAEDEKPSADEASEADTPTLQDGELETGLDQAQSREPEEELDPVAALLVANEQISELKDQALRAHAEVENVRRRSAMDVEKAHKFALDKFVSNLLPVVDSLEKAVEAAAAIDAETDAGTAHSEGVSLSLKLFIDALGKSGVEQIDPTGEPFNPELHEAMTLIEHPDMEPNSVVDTMQKGYTLNGRLVRAAMVVVSKTPAGS